MSLSRYSYVPIAVAGLLSLGPYARTAAAQTLTAPSGGYIYNSADRSVRQISGFIGAAVVGNSVADGIDWISVAPNRKSALAESNGSRIWIPDLTAPANSQTLDRVPSVQQAFWAADASQAAILSGAQLMWLTNFPSAPVPLSSWNLENYIRAASGNATRTETAIDVRRRPAVWTVLAADSSADRLVLASHVGEVRRLWLASSTLPPVNIPFSGDPVAAAFAPNNDGIYVADSSGHQLMQIRNPETTPTLTTVTTSDTYIHDPSAMALSSDGNRLFLADRSDNTIRVFDVSGSGANAGAPIAELPVGATPVALANFDRDYFLVTAGDQTGKQPLLFLNTGTAATISFVPRGE